MIKTSNKYYFEYIFFVILFLNNIRLNAALCTSNGSGDWNNAATWSCGHVPACGDSVVIQAAHTVTITNQQNYEGCAAILKITVYGKLNFTNGNKLELPCNSAVFIMTGGSINPGTGGGNSNLIQICNDNMWSAGDGPITSASCLPPWQPGCATILPVQITHFDAEMADDIHIELHWATASEKDNDRFEIERSHDASSFEKTLSVPTKAENGNSNSVLNYSAIDYEPYSNISYYRLKQVDKNETAFYSKIVSVNVIKAKNVRFLIYPNPNNGEFTADISGIENNHEVKIVLRNQHGEMVYDSSFFLQETNTKLQIVPHSRLTSGIYLCSLILEGIEYSVKVVVS